MGKFKDSMHDTILGEQISDNIYLDNNGQLICENVVLARTGYYDYREDELLDNGSPDKIVKVFRSPEEVFDEESIKSMNYKPLVDEHPEDNVTPETVGTLQKGFMINVRRGTGEFANCLMADLVVTDPYVIDLIRSGKKRELSVGYTADIEDKNGQFIMKNIRGNHIALCEAGRAGNARIRDSKSTTKNFEAKGSFNSIDDLKKFYSGSIISLDGDKIMVGTQGVKLLYSFVNGDKEGKVIFVRKVNDAKVKPADEVVAEEKYLKGSKDIEEVADSELPDPADEKELDRTHFIPDEDFEEDFDEAVDESSTIVDSLRPFRVSVGGRKFDTMATSFADAVNKVRNRLNDTTVLGEYDYDKNDFNSFAKAFKKAVPNEELARQKGIVTKEGLMGSQILTKSGKTYKVMPNSKTGKMMVMQDGAKKIYEVIVVKNGESDSIFVEASNESNAKKMVGSKYGKIVEVNLATWREEGSADLIGDSDTARINDVYPNEGESKEDFISRFMSETKEEYPDKDQRLAVAYAYWKKGVKDSKTVTYKGYAIEFDFYGQREYTVQYQGDDVWFKSESEAKKFIDEITGKKDSVIKDTSTIKAEELKVGDIIYSRYDNKHPELVKCKVDKIIRRNGVLNIQLSEVENGNYFKTTQVVPEATFTKDSAIKDSSFAILHPTRNEFLSVGGRSWVKEDSTNIQKFSSYDEAKEFGEKHVDHQFRIFKFFDAKHVTDHDVEETTKDVANAPKSFQLREYVGNLIDDEVEAVQGYDETLLRTDLDEETRKTLEEIRNDELDHTDKLNAIYRSLTKDPKPVEDDMYGLVKEPEFRYFMVTVLEKSAKWGDEEVNYFVRAKDESEARKKVGGNVVRIVEGNHSEYLKFKQSGQVIDAGMVGYLFPKLNEQDMIEAQKYNLGAGAKNPFKGKAEGTFLLGSMKNVRKFAEEYLDYKLNKDYLVEGESLIK